MLFVYGPYLPVRILEEIRFWKQQEAEHTEVIKAIIPNLEHHYVKLLDEWKKVFTATEAAADRLLQHGLTSKEAASSPQLIKQTERLLGAAFQQSKEFIRQLHHILDRSEAVKAVPLAPVVLMHIIRESEYFLAVLERLNRPGEIAGCVAGDPPVYDPYHQGGGTQAYESYQQPTGPAPYGPYQQPTGPAPFGSYQQPDDPPPYGPYQQPGGPAPFGPYQQPGGPAPFGPYQQPGGPAPFEPYQQPTGPAPFGPYQQPGGPAPFGPAAGGQPPYYGPTGTRAEEAAEGRAEEPEESWPQHSPHQQAISPEEANSGFETPTVSNTGLEAESAAPAENLPNDNAAESLAERNADEAAGNENLRYENDAPSGASRIPERPVPIGGHTLPPLPYPYNALEPYIDEATMRIHHDKHHKTYVDDLNKAEKKLQEARKNGNFELVKHWERELAFNGAGHYLHTIFWEIMNPKGGGRPEGELLQQITRDFGSYDAFHRQFSEAAAKVEGGGWAILVWSPRSHRLQILTAEKHQNLSQWDIVPLLPLDVWEHAYYLKHQNVRADYIKDWWNVVYWPAVAERYEAAKKLKWQPY
ncbi:Fe-Mn family superoxide dismutase [Paenibacillus macerans]|uniref:Fe-Mn family superoxide dismutase n=1 Tax=Paenibacillus macerans TaxID=44252 RepID=UPI002DB65B09|nr:Fe-Mn family superoxide dismutase [Paenibacillus macerans]MEC0153727.1 Fe-Mn family superoxide dismutase [Paenibacillus macerans]